MTSQRRALAVGGSLFALALIAGCADSSGVGEISGMVTVDGKTPPVGSSITFIPVDGKAPTAGCAIEHGKYSARGVPVGTVKVEIRMPRTVSAANPNKQGPGAKSDIVEEMLPPRYNDATELTFDVKPGKNEKSWDLTVK